MGDETSAQSDEGDVFEGEGGYEGAEVVGGEESCRAERECHRKGGRLGEYYRVYAEVRLYLTISNLFVALMLIINLLDRLPRHTARQIINMS